MALATSLSLLASAVTAEDRPEAHSPPVVELTHWWKSPGEQAALQEIRRGVEAHGGKFIDTPMTNYDVLRGSILERLTIGYPPAMTQWLAGDEINGLNAMNAIAAIPHNWRGTPLDKILFPEVLQDISQNGRPAVLPVGTHIQNVAFFNAAIYRQLGLPLPTTWTEFLQQAVLIQQAGYIPLAVSDEPWQLRILFNTILMEKMGVENFNQFYTESKPIARWEAPLTEALAIFLQLKAFTDSGHKGRLWNETSRLVIDDKAGMQVLGDFVKGEMTSAGKVAGKDFLCSLAPGAHGIMVFATDAFVMLKMTSPELLKGQELLFDVVLDPEVQAAFSSKKGGIPVRTGIDPKRLDECARPFYQAWLDRGEQNVRLPDVTSRLRLTFVQKILHKAWTENQTPAAAVQALIQMVS